MNLRLLAFLFWFSCGVFSVKADDTLKVAVYNSKPFGFPHKDGAMGGLMPELWEDISVRLNYQNVFFEEDMDGLLKGLQSGKYDIALGAISITPERERMVDFTHAVNPSGTGMAIAKGGFMDWLHTYGQPILFSLSRLILGITSLLITAGILIWLVERKRNPEHFSEGWKGLLDGMWWSAVTMATVGYGDKVPKSTGGRVLAMSWIFISIVLIALFTANASSIFLNAEKRTAISSLEDLYSAEVGSVAKSSGAEYLERHHIHYKNYENVEAALQGLIHDEVEVVVYNTPVLKFYRHKHFRKQIVVSSEELMKNNMGIALQPNSKYKEDINRVLLEIVAEDEWQRLIYGYFGTD